ncbi:hypothetical protein [Oribacterium sp. P6A1]|uniref:hypothetical protein n=1 Tax=Oribacterium sp. P6A1 TaxID=1410612 RepID=UPI0005691F7D|nr:hypothetical protein [Oribacterium sp. P6A1]
MVKWNFPSRNNSVVEGYSNPGHALFKKDPLQALAREICQNSLDAVDDETLPVRIEFKKETVLTQNFPGASDLLDIIYRCRDYWKDSHKEELDAFIDHAIKILKLNSLSVLRISDFNTIGLQGAFDDAPITPWIGLVKSIGVNVKSNDTAAGSYGIGKAAAFINSYFQTVFYRTMDLEGRCAAQGVANLMAFSDESYGDDDPVRRATGFFGNPDKNQPIERMEELDRIYKRTETGTDIFIPGFKWITEGSVVWTELMIAEILENFLMSIFYGKLSVQIEDRIINKEKLSAILERNKLRAKNAYCFYKILSGNDENVLEENLNFHGFGNLKLRLLFGPNLNKKILVVRNSGMKIAEIKSLPKGISFSGILELQGDNLNKFFRKMENPEHNSWDPKRHDNPKLAKEYKKELETWVSQTIYKKLEEESGEETIVDIGDCFNSSVSGNRDNSDKVQKLVDTTKNVEISFKNIKKSSSSLKTIDSVNSNNNVSSEFHGTDKETGDNANNGNSNTSQNHDRSSGSSSSNEKNATRKTSSRGTSGKKHEQSGSSIISNFKTRIITLESGKNRLFLTIDRDLPHAEIEVVTVGENGQTLPLHVKGVMSSNASLADGKIILNNIKANQKTVVDFVVNGKQNYAMGVNINGN